MTDTMGKNEDYLKLSICGVISKHAIMLICKITHPSQHLVYCQWINSIIPYQNMQYQAHPTNSTRQNDLKPHFRLFFA